MEKLAAAHQRDRDVLNSLLAVKVSGGQPSASPRQPPTPLPRRSSAQQQQQQQQQQRNQHEQEQPRASTSRAVMPPRSEASTAVHGDVVPELTFSEVVRRRLLRMELSKTANAPLMLNGVRKIIGDAGVSRLVPEMGELLVVDNDPLAAEEDIIAALDEKIGASAGVVSASI
uniref:uncharacterized protein LOC125908362 n=1 Tax=Anopheles coluzzii TaxID=1518534 RepID=UPI0020FFDD59|nr:uncharacterized protein LOC125908362 [Anopheles coluzzii]